MKRYLTFLALSLLVIIGYGCKKKNSAPDLDLTSQIKSGTYVWMGSSYSSGQFVGDDSKCDDVFTEFDVTVVNDSSVYVGGDTLPYLRTETASGNLVFGYQRGYSMHPDDNLLYYDPSRKTMEYSSEYFGSSGRGRSFSVSTADYHRSMDLRSFVNNIQGVKNMSGTRYDMKWPMGGTKVDSTTNITAAITFTSLSDTTISFLGILDTGVLYYKKVDQANHTVIWQTHHTDTYSSTLIYNYSSNKFIFEQLEEMRLEKHTVQLQ